MALVSALGLMKYLALQGLIQDFFGGGGSKTFRDSNNYYMHIS